MSDEQFPLPAPSRQVRQWAMLCHFAAFLGLVFPFGSLLGPLIVWQIKKDMDPLIDDQGKEALNFQITVAIAWLVCMVLGFVVIGFLLMLILVVAALVGFDRSAEHAALSLGASQATVFTRITLPMILPGVTGGWMLAFINSFDEVTMSIFVTSPSTVTLPVRMYMYATESIDPLMAAVSALMVALTACAMVILDRVYGLDRVLVGRK